MAEILTQEEIDTLLQALSSGELMAETMQQEEEERRVKNYDFRRPDKFSKEQIRTLSMIHDNFSRSISTTLATKLRSMVEARVASVDQMPYAEFTRSMPNPTSLCIFELPPLEGNAAIELNPNLVFTIIDRLLGGTGSSTIKNRPLTEIELSVIEKIVHSFLGSLKDAWENVISFKPRLKMVEANPLFAQLVPPNDMVVLITIIARIGDIEGMINVCIPYSVLEPVINKLTAQFWFSTDVKESSPEHLSKIQSRLEKAQVPVIVHLGNTRITVRELIELQARDVIQLEKPAEDDLDIMVGTHIKFRGRPGIFGNKISVQVTENFMMDDMGEEEENG